MKIIKIASALIVLSSLSGCYVAPAQPAYVAPAPYPGYYAYPAPAYYAAPVSLGVNVGGGGGYWRRH